MIMNVIAPDEATIQFDGKAFSESIKSRIGYLHEERGLYRKGRGIDTLVYLGVLKRRGKTVLLSTHVMEAVRSLPRWIEATMRESHSAGELFSVVAGRLDMRRFQLMEPSLHAIFVRPVESAGNGG